MIDITDANIYDAISTSIPKSSNQQVITNNLELTFYPYLGFNKSVDITIPSNVATWIDVRFITNIGGLNPAQAKHNES